MLKRVFSSLLISAALAAPAFADERPNILFIFTDDHAPHAIGAYDGWLKSVNPTPSIDQIAAQGMLFKNSFCTNSICGPSRAVIQTGKHSHQNGFMNNGNSFNWDQQTFPKLLKEVGYQTAIYGKSHLKGNPQGYDDWKVLPGQGLYYNPDFFTEDGKITVEGHSTDVITGMATDWLTNQRDAEKPFMLMVQFKAPHRNWMPAERYLHLYDDIEMPEPPTLFDKWEDNTLAAKYNELEIDRHMDINYDLFLDLTADFDQEASQKRQDRSAWNNMKRMTESQMTAWRGAYGPKDKAFHEQNLSGDDLVRWKYQRYAKNYLRCVKGVDDNVGNLMNTLKELELDENTIVIYSSDQGFYIGDHGWYDKRWMYEESLKMPLIVKWPGVTEPGSINEELVQNLDYASTFLDIAGATIPEDLQGQSLVPLLEGAETVAPFRDAIYYHYYEYPSVHMVPRHCGIRTDRYKLIHFYQFGVWEMYDLESDPDELTNIYETADPTLVAEMKEKLEALKEHYGDDSHEAEFTLEKKKEFWPEYSE
ncbi:MAG: sulfatase [Verrucomicrobiales bacterium]|nr:sulfatase [Verrucomicrobiales bacterium]